MLASGGMRQARELRSPLTAALILTGGALFFGGAERDSSLPWLGAGAVALALALLALSPRPQGLRALLPLAALGVWCAASVAWSIEPDRSWSYANRIFVYGAFALVGALLAVEPRRLFYGISALLGAVCAWSLLGKGIPWLYADYGRLARLRGPVGYWNSLALLGDIALPLGLCLATRRRTSGTLLVFGWIVAIGLTYSRSGVALALLAVAAWMALSGAWINALATLVAAGVPAAGVLAVTFSLPGLTHDGEPHATRVRDGLVFLAVVLADAAIAAALSRFEPPHELPRRLRRGLALALALACAAAVVLGGLRAQRAWDSFTSSAGAEVANSPGRFTSESSNFRWAWWTQAWSGFQAHAVEGTGAGSFQFTNERYRSSALDETIEPHNLPLQFLSETGIVGLAVFIAAMGWLVLAARRHPGPQLALALALPIYLLHALLDIDWDFAAVSAPVFLIAGALIARPEARRRASPPAVAAAAGLGLALLCSLFAVWLANRWTDQAGNLLGINNARALTLVNRAHSLDPVSIEPLITGAAAEGAIAGVLAQGARQHAALAAEVGFLQDATTVQPSNAEGWFELGSFYLAEGCPRAALPDMSHATVLDGKDPEYANGYAAALAKVNSGTYRC